MLGSLEPYQIEEILMNQPVGRLASCADNVPYVVPISYAYDGEYIYCHTGEGRKVEILRKNPTVCFQVDEMMDMANWKCVVVYGTFEELKGREERNKAMSILLNRYLPVISSVTTHLGEHWPFHPDDTSDIKGVVFRIAIKSKSGRFESNVLSPSMAG